MKNLIIPIDHLVMLAELDDKDAGLMAKAIAQYANKGIAPSFSNSALKAIFTLFRSIIDAQRESSAKRSEINTTNAMSKKSAAKKKAAKKATATDSESQQIADDATDASEAVEESLPLDAIEAVYPKLGTYRNESLSIWESFNEEKKRKAIGFVQTYISQTPNAIDQMYLNRYLGAEPWEKEAVTSLLADIITLWCSLIHQAHLAVRLSEGFCLPCERASSGRIITFMSNHYTG